jgi:gamma-glutamylcyclotransferase (GGCT)/AIG2-like uncharacterized protein YtfP
VDARAYVHFLLTGGRIFVYGTMMQGEEAHFKLRGSRFLGKTRTVPRFRLETLGDDFEGLAHGGDQAVPGELYQVSFDKLLELDDWEYDIYAREYIHVEDGSVCDAYVLRRDFERRLPRG